MTAGAFLALALAACFPSDDVEPVPSARATPVADTDCADAVPTDGAFLGVTVVDVGEHPLGADAVLVRWCRDGRCLLPACVEGDVFHLGGLAAGIGLLEIVPLGKRATTLAAASVPWPVEAGASTAITVHLPPLERPVPLTPSPAVHEVAVGLHLTVAAGDLVGDGAEPVVSVAAVDATGVTLPIRGLAGDVLAVYDLAPHGVRTRCLDAAPDGTCRARHRLPVALDNRWSIGPEGLVLWTVDPDAAAWRRLGPFRRDSSQRLVPPEGLDGLQTLVIARGP